MNIKLIRLQTGEDLIADVVADTAEHLTLENPCMVFVRPSQSGTASIGITRWLPYAEDKQFKLERRWVVLLSDPVSDLKNEYNTAFGSGIVVAPSTLKVN